MDEKIIKTINTISKKVDKGTEDLQKISGIVNEKFAALTHELTEAYIEIERLEEENNIMRSDLTVILDYMKTHKIDMTYVVKFRAKEKEAH